MMYYVQCDKMKWQNIYLFQLFQEIFIANSGSLVLKSMKKTKQKHDL